VLEFGYCLMASWLWFNCLFYPWVGQVLTISTSELKFMSCCDHINFCVVIFHTGIRNSLGLSEGRVGATLLITSGHARRRSRWNITTIYKGVDSSKGWCPLMNTHSTKEQLIILLEGVHEVSGFAIMKCSNRPCVPVNATFIMRTWSKRDIEERPNEQALGKGGEAVSTVVWVNKKMDEKRHLVFGIKQLSLYTLGVKFSPWRDNEADVSSVNPSLEWMDAGLTLFRHQLCYLFMARIQPSSTFFDTKSSCFPSPVMQHHNFSFKTDLL